MAEPTRRARRHDPDRRARIIEAALVVLARDGVGSTTHRSVAREADVPLGSMTYHFASLDDLVMRAFEQHVDKLASRFERRLAAAGSVDEVLVALAESVTVDLAGDDGDLALTFELYGAAVRRPGVRALTQAWMSRAERALLQHVDGPTARMLDAVLEGLMVHRAIGRDPVGAAEVLALLERALADAAPG